MVNDAKKNESADKEKKEKIDVVNQAEHLIYETEKNINEHGDKLEEKEKSELAEKVSNLKKAKDTGNIDDIKSSLDALNSIWSKYASKMYSGEQEPNNEPKKPPKDEKGKKDKKNDEIEDADFEVVE